MMVVVAPTAAEEQVPISVCLWLAGSADAW